jgi:hypothetical protein
VVGVCVDHKKRTRSYRGSRSVCSALFGVNEEEERAAFESGGTAVGRGGVGDVDAAPPFAFVV